MLMTENGIQAKQQNEETCCSLKCVSTSSLQTLFSRAMLFIVLQVWPADSRSLESESRSSISLMHSSGRQLTRPGAARSCLNCILKVLRIFFIIRTPAESGSGSIPILWVRVIGPTPRALGPHPRAKRCQNLKSGHLQRTRTSSFYATFWCNTALRP